MRSPRPARRLAAAFRPAPTAFRFADEDEAKRRLTGAGLADPRVETLRFAHRLESPIELWDGSWPARSACEP
jgi:hypothetical protein